MTQRPRVVVVDDHALFRTGVRAEIRDAVDLVGEAADVETAVEVITANRPDVVLLDVHLPDGSGADVITRAGLATSPGSPGAPETKYLALSVSDAAEDVIAVIRAGAQGYVTKTIAPAELVDAIARVAGGDVVFSPRLAGFVLDAFRDTGLPPGSLDPELDQLTPREREVLRLLARGYAYKEIAEQLVISARTVETHASNVLRKLQLSNRHELTRWAAERRLN